jgi:hypothetical protein
MVYKAIVRRVQMLSRNNTRELKANTEYWGKFSNRWEIIIQAAKEAKYLEYVY